MDKTDARQAPWAVHVSKIYATGLDISRPLYFRGISSSIRPVWATPLASLHGLGRLRSFERYIVLGNAIISKFSSV